jgi:hypothetical protein
MRQAQRNKRCSCPPINRPSRNAATLMIPQIIPIDIA